jgi:hypothetical protein
MFAANRYVIRQAGPTDADVVNRIARLDTQRPLIGDVLIGETGGVPGCAPAWSCTGLIRPEARRVLPERTIAKPQLVAIGNGGKQGPCIGSRGVRSG